MTKTNYLWAVVLVFAVCKAQFFYNDDEQPAYQDPAPQDNTYEYDNPPTAAQYSPSQRRSNSENFHEPVSYQPAPPAPPASAPRYEHRPAPSRGRQRRVEHRQRPPPPPRVYSPSIFQNLAVGKPPDGVSIPEDSFLNVLTNGGRTSRARQSPAYEPPPPQETAYVQPAPPAQAPSPPRQRDLFVQPPPPQARSAPAYAQNPPAVSSRASGPYSRGPAPPPRVQRTHASPPSVHNLPQIGEAQPEPIRNPVQYQAPAPAPAPVQPSPRHSRRRSGVGPRQTAISRSWNSDDDESRRPRRVFGPSVFENLGPGIAPPGIHVPQDSFLNILRNDKHNIRRRRDQDYDYEFAPLAAPEEQYALPEQEEQYAPPAPTTRYEPPPPVARNAPPAPVARNARPAPVARHAPPAPVARHTPPAPVARYAPPAQYSTESRPSTQEFSTDHEPPHEIPVVQSAPRRASRQHQRPRPQPEYDDNSANHQTNNEQPRVVQQQRKPVQSRRKVTDRRHRQHSGSIPDVDENEEEIRRPPKQFAPSVFEKVGLGEAPPGIHIPEDSFLNLLRGDTPSTRASQSSGNQRSHRVSQYVPPPEPAPVTSEDAYDNQNRRSRVSHTAQSPSQQQRRVPVQEHQPVNAEPQREVRRPIAHEAPKPASAPRAVQSQNRQGQRSRSQTFSAPRPQPIYEAPNDAYNAHSDLLEDDYTLRYRSQDNSQRVRQQEQVAQRKRVDAAPRYVPPPPPQPVYEAPQPNYDDSSSFEPDDIQRRRPTSRNQRPAQVQQPVQRPRADSQSHRRPPPPQPQPKRNDEIRDTRQQNRFKAAKLSVKPLPDDVDGDQIPGEAGIDYPTFHVIPSTSFSCAQQPHNGYYADLETSCQVVHMCQSGGVQSSFLCPNGTIFNQENFSCQWWYKVNCADAPSHYGINDKLYKVPPPPSRRRNEE